MLAPLFFVALFAAQAAALGGWKGQIIDRDSGAPIEGAVVLMVWSRCTFISFHGCNARYYDSAEALTDAGGRFVLVRPLFLRLFAFLVKDQHFYVFKGGYGVWNFARYPNTDLSQGRMDKFWRQAKNEGAIIELPPVPSPEQRRSFYVNSDRTPRYDVPKGRAKLWHEANETEWKYLEQYRREFGNSRKVEMDGW